MATSLTPSEFANLVGVEPTDFCEACRNGVSEYAGYPVGDWLVGRGKAVRLNVPDELVEKHGSNRGMGSSSRQGRSNGHVDFLKVDPSMLAGMSDKPNWPEAARDAAPPVSANAGAAYAAGKFADTVREQPQLMGDFVDAAALLGSMGLAYATAEEGEVVKAGATAAGVFATFKLFRYLSQQGNRQMDMAERQQRHQIQQQRQTTRALPEKRGDGASANTVGSHAAR